jgi:hypothetical protein
MRWGWREDGVRVSARGEGTLSVGGANAPPQIFLKNSSFGLNFTIYAPSLI